MDDFTRVLCSSRGEKAEDYTEKAMHYKNCYRRRKRQLGVKRSTLTNAQLQQLIDKLEEGMQGLKPAGTPGRTVNGHTPNGTAG